MMTRTLPALLIGLMLVVFPSTGRGGEAPADSPTDSPAEATESERFAASADWKNVAEQLGGTGSLKPLAFTVAVPRNDLFLSYEGGDIPIEAGIESAFHFFRCPCGKINVIGQFCVIDYEANDVVDALRDGGMKIASISPMFLGDRPRLSMVRFQGEGEMASLLATLKEALGWTGEARNSPRPIE